MSEPTPEPAVPARVMIVLTTGLLVISSPWILQAFVPEPYFLRTPEQLKIMSTPNGFGQIERSPIPFYSTVGIETVALLSVAVLGWLSRSKTVALAYLLAVLSMASITLWRVSAVFRELK